MARTFDIPEKEKAVSYRYEALNPQGRAVKGTVKATSELAAERLIIDKGYDPIHVEVAPSMFSLEEALPSLFKVKLRDVSVFSRQLATLLRSGISLLPALEVLHGQVTSSRAFKKILGAVINDIRAGSSFSDAIAKHPRAFGDIYCRTIAVGEQTGNMETVLLQMADFQEKQSSASQKVRKALAYPMMIMGVGVVVVIILLVFVMPNLIGMFTAMEVELPLPTRILIGLSEFLTGVNQIYLLVGLVVVVAAVVWLLKQSTGRRLLDRLRLSAPIIGPPILMTELARFSRTMSVLVGAGLNLQEIMEIAPQATSNTVFRDALKHVHEGLLLGEGLSEPMRRIGIFPPLLVQMVAVGEESNTLDSTMGVVADFYETTAEEKVNSMVGMIGPLATVGIAVIVGFIALSIIMPMYTLTGAFG